MTVVAIKGVDPGTQNIYLTEKFKCIDGNGYGLVNDDYCDCIDGSDEPGTNACYDGKFYCQNEGYLSTFIPSWLVSDGICECCDGSDEVEGLCENTCQERSSKALNEKHKQEKQRKLGAMSKLRMIETAKLLRIKKRLEIEKLTREIDSLKKEKYSTEILIKTLEYQLDDPHQGWIDKLQGMAYHWPETGFYLFNKVFHEMEVGSGLVEDRDRLENGTLLSI